jgi:hypothetical protein
MPVHRVPRASLDATIIELERSGAEDIISVVADRDDMVLVTRKRYSPRYETRKSGI